MYLTRGAITETLRQVAAFAPGSMLVMSFMLPRIDAPMSTRRFTVLITERE